MPAPLPASTCTSTSMLASRPNNAGRKAALSGLVVHPWEADGEPAVVGHLVPPLSGAWAVGTCARTYVAA